MIEKKTPKTWNGAKLLGDFAPGSPEWHSERSKGVGGSEVGTILGLNPWESAYALWAKKLNKIPSEVKENWAIRFGKAFEDPILELWAEDHPEWNVYTTGTYQDPKCDYRHANPDAIAVHKETGEEMVIEVKTSRNSWEEAPKAYLAQVMHYMGVMGIKRGVIIAVAGMTWFEQDVPFNQDWIDMQNESIDRFWECVTKDTKPAWDGSESTYNAVRVQNSEIDGTEFDLGQLGLDMLAAQLEADKAYYRLTQLKSQALDQMGTAKFGVAFDGGTMRRVASRQMRAGNPSLIINKKG